MLIKSICKTSLLENDFVKHGNINVPVIGLHTRRFDIPIACILISHATVKGSSKLAGGQSRIYGQIGT